jgi:hypothetical protein
MAVPGVVPPRSCVQEVPKDQKKQAAHTSCTVCLCHTSCPVCCLPAQVVELIKRTPRESRPGDFVPDSGTLQGSLELQNVVFAYPGRPTQRVLNGLSLAVSPGARWAVRLTGCGAAGGKLDASAALSWTQAVATVVANIYNTIQYIMEEPPLGTSGSTSLRAASAHTLFSCIIPFISVGRLRSPSVNSGT